MKATSGWSLRVVKDAATSFLDLLTIAMNHVGQWGYYQRIVLPCFFFLAFFLVLAVSVGYELSTPCLRFGPAMDQSCLRKLVKDELTNQTAEIRVILQPPIQAVAAKHDHPQQTGRAASAESDNQQAD